MKVAHKVGLVVSVILILTISLLSWYQYAAMKASIEKNVDNSIQEISGSLSHQISNWLNGKTEMINLLAEAIDDQFSPEYIQKLFNRPLLKQEFITVFGGLDTDGKAIHNDPTWDTSQWDARKRPWYAVARASNEAVLTDPYTDSNTGDIIISVVANFTQDGRFKGAFGGDLSLKTVSDAVNTLNFGGAGYAYILNKNGTIISHPDAKLNDKHYKQLFDGQAPGLKKQLAAIELNGDSVFVSFTPLSELTSVDWYIGVVLDQDKVLAEASQLGWRTFIGGAFGIIIGFALLMTVMGRILKPLQLLNDSLIEINRGEGDLTRRLPNGTQDEFGQVAAEFNGFTGKLQGLIMEIKQLNGQILDQSTLTSSDTQNSAQQLEQQLSELDQLASAMLQMASSANEVASYAKQAAEATEQADKETQNGVGTVSHSTEMIAQLAAEMDDAVATVNEVAQFSTNIESILQVIAGIAEQTNLLALNAAIEAARAGESGRGFAVVADEVRSLASRTQESTDEIRVMIEQLQSGVKNAEQKIMHSRDTASATVDEARESNQTLQNIRERISQISDMNLQIASAAEQQSVTSEEVNRNTTKIRDISQTVVETATHQVEQCQNMTVQVNRQDKILGQFKV